ncbi:MAG: hypothetical protein KF833_07355 [Verrucomicrobiae bacterium]|nr:hypothetical protein [Verrucomicrobiae bacterium]
MKAICCGVLMGAMAVLSGCGSGGSSSGVDADALEAVFQGEAAVEETAPDESTTDVLVLPSGGAAGSEVSLREVAGQAAVAIRKDDLAEAMMLLQTLRRARNLSPNQLTAVQDQMAALQSDLASRAESGDARAKQALDLIMQSTRW